MKNSALLVNLLCVLHSVEPQYLLVLTKRKCVSSWISVFTLIKEDLQLRSVLDVGEESDVILICNICSDFNQMNQL